MEAYLIKIQQYDLRNHITYDDFELYDCLEEAINRKDKIMNSDYFNRYRDNVEIENITIETSINKLLYKGLYTEIQYCSNTKMLYGKIENIRDLVTFESDNCIGIEDEFHKAVDEYLKTGRLNKTNF